MQSPLNALALRGVGGVPDRGRDASATSSPNNPTFSPNQIRLKTGEIRELSGRIRLKTGEIRELSGQIRLKTGEIRELSDQIRLKTGEIRELSDLIREATETVRESIERFIDKSLGGPYRPRGPNMASALVEVSGGQPRPSIEGAADEATHDDSINERQQG